MSKINSTLSPEQIAAHMRPYRERIDDIDARLIKLLRERYDVIEEVGHFKPEHGIAATLQDRVDEVRENAAFMAAACGLDEDFIRKIYAQIIEHSCALEEEIKAGIEAPQSLKKAS